jgi:hypothetical protein
MMNNKKMIFAAVGFVLVVAILAGVWLLTRSKPVEGEKKITVTVVHKDGSEKVFTYQTDEEYLGALLYAEGLIIADESNPGMFHTADGEKADFSVDQSYWALYQGEEYAMEGIEKTVIQDGDTFRLVYTIYVPQ